MAAVLMWFITLCVSSIQLHVVFSQTTKEVRTSCTDGTYTHDGRQCCMCGIGQKVVQHCSTSPIDGKCEPCEDGRYSSQPNDQVRCKACTSCSHPSENLEDEESCTPGRDAKCRCKKDHYCASRIETCRLCQACKVCGAEGVKEPCTGDKDTVCNDQIEGGNQTWTWIGTIFGILCLLAIVAVVVIMCKKKLCSKGTESKELNGISEMEMQPIRVAEVDMQPHLPDIAEEIGWKDMQEIALRSNISTTIIDAHKLNNPGDCQEQTLQLLRTWTERQGRQASTNLVQILQNTGKKKKAEKVAQILSHDA